MHSRWLRKLLGIRWKDKVTNEEVQRRTGMTKLENIPKPKKLRYGNENDREQICETTTELAAR